MILGFTETFTLISNVVSVVFVTTFVDHHPLTKLPGQVVAADCETVRNFEWQRDAATVDAPVFWDPIFCTLTFDYDDQFLMSPLGEMLDAPSVSFFALYDSPSNSRWLGLKGSQALPYGSVAGTSLFSSNNRSAGGSQGNSGFSANTRVDQLSTAETKSTVWRRKSRPLGAR